MFALHVTLRLKAPGLVSNLNAALESAPHPHGRPQGPTVR